MKIKKRIIIMGCRSCPACSFRLDKASVIYICIRTNTEIPQTGFLNDCPFVQIRYRKHYFSIMPKVSEEEKKARISGKGKYFNPGYPVIQKRIAECGLCAPKLAEMLGISRALFYRLLKTTWNQIKYKEQLKKLCYVLNLDLYEVFPIIAESEKWENELKNVIARESENK